MVDVSKFLKQLAVARKKVEGLKLKLKYTEEAAKVIEPPKREFGHKVDNAYTKVGGSLDESLFKEAMTLDESLLEDVRDTDISALDQQITKTLNFHKH